MKLSAAGPEICHGPRFARVRRLACGWALTLLVAGAIAVGRVVAADDDFDGPARFHDVKKWRGTIVATARAEPNVVAAHDRFLREGGKGAYWEFAYHASARVDFVLTEYESDPSVWTGEVTNSSGETAYRYFVHVPASYKNGQTWDKSYGENEWTFSAASPFDFSSDRKVELQFHRQRGWSVRLASGRLATEIRTHNFNHIPPKEEQDPEHDTITGADTSIRSTQKTNSLGVGSTSNQPYPKEGLVLRASAQKTVSFPCTGTLGFTPSVIWDYQVYLEPGELEELRLEIDEPVAYRTWRPQTTPDRKAGAPLEVTARVVTAKGGKPEVAVASFEWELQQTSREPGVTLNFPVGAADSKPDIELEAKGEFFVLENENQRMTRAVRSGVSDTVSVVPYDWGGWSTLQVTAVLANGRRLTGKLKGSDEAGLRIPKRRVDSKIADGWKLDKKVSGADAEDDENEPVGDGVKGDGLTLYEEYRGFYQNGQRLEGEPKKKDFFVRLEDTEFAAPAAKKFASASGLAVHWLLTKQEFPASRVINANRSLGPNIVKQHGVVVRMNNALDDKFTTIGAPGTPGMITAVELCPGSNTAEDMRRIYAKIAHELGHCVNIAHHGEADYPFRKMKWSVKDNKLWEENLISGGPAQRIYTITEKLDDWTDATIKAFGGEGGWHVHWMAKLNGQHSGFENCLMRYDCAYTYQSPYATDNRVVEFTKELTGHALCQSPAGTGVNDANRREGYSRYGDATPGRGDCLHQIHVTDAVPGKRRTGTEGNSPSK